VECLANGDCDAGQTCITDLKECCTPFLNPCTGYQCGQAGNGCGGFVSCGLCPVGRTCDPTCFMCLPPGTSCA
jgi:hypothetical protein